MAGVLFVYLAGVNLFLALGGVAKLFESTNTVNVTFARAWSVWPGTVHLRQARVVFQDANLQWSLDLAKVVVVIRLRDLPRRVFHASELRGDGTVFRMRHRVMPESANLRSIAAVPALPEFPGPAVFEARVPEAPIPDAEYALWTVHLENVDVEIEELWAQQFRYRGGGRARGDFQLKPARELWVGPASLELDGGRVSVAEQTFIQHLRGKIGCVVHPFDVRKPVGSEVFRFISTTLDLKGDGVRPEALGVLIADSLPAKLSSEAGRLSLNGRIDRGRITPGSRLELAFAGLKVEHPSLGVQLEGVRFAAGGQADGSGALDLDVENGALEREQAQALRLGKFQANAQSSSLDTAIAWSLREASFELGSLLAPDLRWFNPAQPSRAFRVDAGSGELAARGRYAGGQFDGWTRVNVDSLQLRAAELAGELTGQLNLELRNLRHQERSGSLVLKFESPRSKLLLSGSEVSARALLLDVSGAASEGQGSAKVALDFAELRAKTSSLTAQARGQLRVEVPQLNWHAGVSEARGELVLGAASARTADIELEADRAEIKGRYTRGAEGRLAAQLTAKVPALAARIAKLRARAASELTASWSRDAGAGNAMNVTLLASLQRALIEDPSEAQSARTHAKAARVEFRSSGASDPAGRWSGRVRASLRGLSARLGNTWLRAEPELDLILHQIDFARRQGRAQAELSLDNLLADDRSEGSECPWSRIGRIALRSEVTLNGLERTSGTLQGDLERTHLVWGDFHVQGGMAVDATLSDFNFASKRGRAQFALSTKEAQLRSGTGPTSGWEARIPNFSVRTQWALGELPSGTIELDAARAQGRIGKTEVHTDLNGELRVTALDWERREGRFSGDVRLSAAGLRAGDERVEDWWARIHVESALLAVHQSLDLTGLLRADLRDGLPGLRVLAAGGSLPGWVPEALPLRELQVEGFVARRCRLTDINITRVAGGPLESRGRLQSLPDEVRGAFLVRLEDLGVISAGVKFDGTETGVSMFAGDTWLREQLGRLDGRARARMNEPCVQEPRQCDF